MSLGLPSETEVVRKHTTGFILYGVVIILLGLLSIAAPMLASIAVAIMLGWLLLFGGASGLAATFSEGRHAHGFGWHLLISVVYVFAGLSLLISPVAGVVTLTIVLAAYLLAGGVVRIIMSFGYRRAAPGAWFWVLLSGIIDIVLAFIIMSGMPGTATWVLGLLVGINLLMMGFSIVMVTLAVRRVTN
jgi:uncharacterized membrane protein HdeD (DUF308 family)